MRPNTLPDEAQLIRAAQRDSAEFAPLYRHYVTPVYRYLYSRTGNAADAEDLAAQVFLEALQGLPRYRHRGHFAAWLFTIARRRAADHYRQPTALPLDELLTPADDDEPLSLTVRAETLAHLHRLVAGLDERDVELLRLRYAAGLTFTQIGAALNQREGGVKMRLHRLLARLQTALGGER
ncbi:MAG: sigma-70 family RNA polymerase sigma factor [Anaerolineales bacterium]|nr:sigma-70 family RNA polymerase sigma factor [Anaerolineales bacterium]